MYWRVQFPPGWLWNKHLYADLRITYLHTFATFILHLQHLLAYICNIYLHTYATITCIHLQHLLAYICNIYLHTFATFTCIHLQHLCAYICNIYAHTFATFMRIHNTVMRKTYLRDQGILTIYFTNSRTFNGDGKLSPWFSRFFPLACKNICFLSSKWFKGIWDKIFKSGLSTFCGRQPLKNLLSPLWNTLSHFNRHASVKFPCLMKILGGNIVWTNCLFGVENM